MLFMKLKRLTWLFVLPFVLGCGANSSDSDAKVEEVVVKDSTDVVYGTPNSDKYHNSKECRALKNASEVVEIYREQAVKNRKPCKNCVDTLKTTRPKVYTVEGSNIYHAKPSCFHIKNSKKVKACEEDSVKLAKKRCKDCWK
jgi:hypothetical protein